MKLVSCYGVFPRRQGHWKYVVRHIIGETERSYLVKGSRRTSTLMPKYGDTAPVALFESENEAVSWVKKNKRTYSRG